jgi:hypothetical protein
MSIIWSGSTGLRPPKDPPGAKETACKKSRESKKLGPIRVDEQRNEADRAGAGESPKSLRTED